jgi:predicted small integral membrane protein
MFYCWSYDLIGELPETFRGNVYIMIMIEHFSKWVKLVALLNKSSHNTNQAFLQHVLSRFGAYVECLIDQRSDSEENSNNYLTMLSLTIVRLQGIIPKLMALHRRWFRHARRDYKRFASLRTKRIGTWPYLTSPWV